MRKILFSLFLLFALGFFLPQIASGSWAKKQITAHLQKQLGGEVLIEKISLSWWGKQQCLGLIWNDPRNGIALSADTLTIEDHLFDCIRYKDTPLSVSVIGAKMDCKANLKLIRKKKRKELHLKCSPILAQIENGHVLFEEIAIDVTDSLRIQTWGKINLKKQHMDITLGLPPRALHKMFGISDLPEEFLLEIPISCKMSGKALEKKLLGFFLKNYAKVTSLQR